MNSKRIAFGIGIVLAILTVLVAHAAAENSIYFGNVSTGAPVSPHAEPGETIHVGLWVDIEPDWGAAAWNDDIHFNTSVLSIDVASTTAGPNFTTMWIIVDYSDQGFVRMGSWSTTMMNQHGRQMLANITMVANATNIGISPLHHEGNNVGTYAGVNLPNQTWKDNIFSSVPSETFATSLAPGWNLISLPLTPLDDSTSAVLGNDDCTIVYGEVYSYDASTNLFVDVTTGTMETGVGYFVDVTTAGTWSYEGFADESLNSELSQGLNCVGWTNTNADLPGAFDSIAGDYRYVARWYTAEQKYELYDPVGETEGPEFIDFTTMEKGVGYFIAATTGCTLTYP